MRCRVSPGRVGLNELRVDLRQPEDGRCRTSCCDSARPTGRPAGSDRAADPADGVGHRRVGRGRGVPFDVAGRWTVQVGATHRRRARSRRVGRCSSTIRRRATATCRSANNLPDADRQRRRPSTTTAPTSQRPGAAARHHRGLDDIAPVIRSASRSLERHRRGHLELVVAAALRVAVGAPADERGTPWRNRPLSSWPNVTSTTRSTRTGTHDRSLLGVPAARRTRPALGLRVGVGSGARCWPATRPSPPTGGRRARSSGQRLELGEQLAGA